MTTSRGNKKLRIRRRIFSNILT